MHDKYKHKRKKILKKLYYMQMGGYNFGKDLLNIPLYAGASYANGLQMGKSLDYDVESQKDLGNMAAINSGMNSLATLLNNRSRAKEERERLNRKQDENYYNTPQDRYRYADYSNSPRQASFFQNGGEIGSDEYLYQQYRKSLPENLQRETPQMDLGTGKMSTQLLQNGGQIPVSNYGLYEYPGQPVIVPSNDITMENIDYNVLAVPDNDEPVIMTPNKKYKFRNSNVVIEYPLL